MATPQPHPAASARCRSVKDLAALLARIPAGGEVDEAKARSWLGPDYGFVYEATGGTGVKGLAELGPDDRRRAIDLACRYKRTHEHKVAECAFAGQVAGPTARVNDLNRVLDATVANSGDLARLTRQILQQSATDFPTTEMLDVGLTVAEMRDALHKCLMLKRTLPDDRMFPSMVLTLFENHRRNTKREARLPLMQESDWRKYVTIDDDEAEVPREAEAALRANSRKRFGELFAEYSQAFSKAIINEERRAQDRKNRTRAGG